MLNIFQKNTKVLFFATILILSLGLTSLPENVEASPPKIPGSEPELVFPVISDTQINSPDDLERFGNVLEQLNEIAPEQDAIVFNGDLTSHGYKEEYDGGMNVFNKYVQSQAEQLFTIGNHEYNNGSSAKESKQRFLEKTGMESLYYHKVINDYDFIVLGEESIGYYSKKQIGWLEEQLKQAEQRDPKKPIFVFMHWPLKDTVYGSDTWYFQSNLELLYDTLEQYPQVVLFSGHLHYPISDPRAIHQKDFTSVNSGSVRYMWTEKGYLQGELPPGNHVISNGLLVEVYNNRVVIKRRGFHANDWVGEPWIIKTPAKTNKFKYTENRDKKNPYFQKEATISVIEEKTTTTDLHIKFSQASDNLLVHSYRVTATNKETGEIENEYLAFSEYYKAVVPEELTFPINGLQPGEEYIIKVRAIDAFGNESTKGLMTVAKTNPVEIVSTSANPGSIGEGGSTSIEVTLHNYGNETTEGIAKVEAPDGWNVQPQKQTYQLSGESEKTLRFEAIAPNGFSGLAEFIVTAGTGDTSAQSKTVSIYVDKLLGENFEGLQSSLKPAVDEQISESLLGWTHKAPSGWDVVNDPGMPQGMTEWQGWSFATKEFRTAADKQGRENFSLGSNIMAIADSDEWDDKGSPSTSGTFDSTLKSPKVDVTDGQTLYLSFATHYKQYANQTALVIASFDNGEKQTLVRYDEQSDSDNAGDHVLNTYVKRQINVPEEASSMTLSFRLFNAGNNWFWAIDDIRLGKEPPYVTAAKMKAHVEHFAK